MNLTDQEKYFLQELIIDHFNKNCKGLDRALISSIEKKHIDFVLNIGGKFNLARSLQGDLKRNK